MDIKKFDGLNVSSKFGTCGLPIRVDTYKTCSFGCRYCFAETRKIMEYKKVLQIANISSIRKRLERVLDGGEADSTNFLDCLIKAGITWHCGGMSDPFQPCEREYGITSELVELTKEYGVNVLFSTKSNTVYNCRCDPDIHTFQLSITNADNRRDIEPNVPDIESRCAFYRKLKDEGFRVGVRIQPLIPGVSDLRIVEKFSDADHFILEGVKIVPQNKECKDFMFNELGLNREDFTQVGLLRLKPELRMKIFQPFIDYFEEHGISYNVSDLDMRKLGNNVCCCGDALVKKATGFNTRAMISKYNGIYGEKELMAEVDKDGVGECKCYHLFTSNRTEGCRTVGDFCKKRVNRKTSPFCPEFQYPCKYAKQATLDNLF